MADQITCERCGAPDSTSVVVKKPSGDVVRDLCDSCIVATEAAYKTHKASRSERAEPPPAPRTAFTEEKKRK